MQTMQRIVGMNVEKPLPTSMKKPNDLRFAYDSSNTE